MIPWEDLESVTVPGSCSELTLHQRGKEFSIRVNGKELMNSRAYCSEDAFSELACAQIQNKPRPRVLIGGLGMGYSLRSALNHLPPEAEIIVAELVPRVVQWNRELFGHLADHPLRDIRVKLRETDVACLLREAHNAYDLILLDVDNSPDALVRSANDWIYSHAGLIAAREALRPGGVLGVWSSSPDNRFVRRLQQVGFDVEESSLRAVTKTSGAWHTIWLAVVRSGRHRLAPRKAR